MEWMFWSLPTALFFGGIILILAGMLVFEIRSPSVSRRGLLPMVTTRGDRLFIGLLGTAFINLGWLLFTDATQWLAVPLCLLFMFLVARYG